MSSLAGLCCVCLLSNLHVHRSGGGDHSSSFPLPGTATYHLHPMLSVGPLSSPLQLLLSFSFFTPLATCPLCLASPLLAWRPQQLPDAPPHLPPHRPNWHQGKHHNLVVICVLNNFLQSAFFVKKNVLSPYNLRVLFIHFFIYAAHLTI